MPTILRNLLILLQTKKSILKMALKLASLGNHGKYQTEYLKKAHFFNHVLLEIQKCNHSDIVQYIAIQPSMFCDIVLSI